MSGPVPRTAFIVLVGLSLCHLINDMLQALLPAIYPMIKVSFGLDFWQIGLITMTNQVTASLLQPLVGHYTDRRPQPYSLAAGMMCTTNPTPQASCSKRGSYRPCGDGSPS